MRTRAAWGVAGVWALAVVSGGRAGKGERRESVDVDALELELELEQKLGWDAAPGKVQIVDCSASIAVAAAVGLRNRGGTAFADCASSSTPWSNVLDLESQVVNAQTFLNRAVQDGVFKGAVLFEGKNHISENLAITAAGLFDLLPMAHDDVTVKNIWAEVSTLPVHYDFRKKRNTSARGAWFKTYRAALEYTIKHFLPYSNDRMFSFRAPGSHLVPFIVLRRLVAVYLDGMTEKCLEYLVTPPFGREYVAKANGLLPFLDLTSSAHWDVSKKPLDMMGYSAGLTESTGWCTRNGTMGVIASDNAESLALLRSLLCKEPERMVSASRPLVQPAFERIKYDPSKIYVSHVVSDGDNLSFLGKTRRYLERRAKYCATKPCTPRAWTISPHLGLSSPATRGYYDIAQETKVDSFLLPPSGGAYFLPASASDKRGLRLHRKETLRVAKLLDIQATIIWDFFYNFKASQHVEYIRGFINSDIKAIFWSATPWLLSPGEKYPGLPKLGYSSDQVYRHKSNASQGVVVFQELVRWGTTSGPDTIDGKSFTPQAMGDLVASQPKGSLNSVYDISWGVPFEDFETYVRYMREKYADKVVVVDHRALIDLACQKHEIDCS
mmetsp:Transcript_15052/g.26843  ORF Transcript_15052/g.26843 Transcript_15052/m.26843 type:complete len:610 (+) Transcript_15052:159-1988(+)